MTTFCRATLSYARGDGLAGGTTPVEVDILDGRAADLPGWLACGFERLDHASAVTDWTDDGAIAAVHYPEAEAIAAALTGAEHTLVADHVKRNAEDAKRAREQQPVRLVHSDFYDDYGDIVRRNYRAVKGRGAAALARAGLTSEDVQHASRIVMLQLWRNLGAPKMDLPVAWCDCRTVRREEMRPFLYTGYVAGAEPFRAVAFTEPAEPGRHRWYAFPELGADEVVAFRTYDTDMVPAGEPYFTPHSAFPDPDVEPGRPPRFSIELRVLCVWR